MTDKLSRVREIVKSECSEWDWNFHIPVVVNYAKLLAKKLGENEELAELGALLHDIGRVKFGPKDHEKTGVPEAEKILKTVGYKKEIIDEIKHCVESHRGSKDVTPNTITAKIVANADAMSHLDTIFHLVDIGAKNLGGDINASIISLSDKLRRNWNKKLTIPEAKELVKDKYDAAILLLETTKNLIDAS
ncbi:MAG: HD domain-containing protein [Candidatus Altiarchaeota archaeon]|nr:HD domain-containing protein [Candidatus Altiarchaeota archaeon]